MIRRLGCAVIVAGLLLAPHVTPVVHADDPAPTPTPVATVAASPTPVATAAPVYIYPPGVPAIAPQPRLRAQALANTAAYSTTATYTAADVRAFLAAHPLFQTADGSAPVIDAIDFIPAAQASARLMGESIGRPDTTLVCFVKLHGPIILPHSVMLPTHHPVPKRHTHRATTPTRIGQLVFDAQTGNLLLRSSVY